MSSLQLREWQSRLGLSNAQAAEALGVSPSGYSQMRKGVHSTTGRKLPIDTRTTLACAAIEHLATYTTVRDKDDQGDLDPAVPEECRLMLLALIDAVSTGPWRPLLPAAEMAQADPALAMELLGHLEKHGEKMMASAINSLRGMIGREVARKIMADIENTEGEK